MVFTVFDVGRVDIGGDRTAEARWWCVVDGAIRNEADVILHQVAILSILPRVKFNPETWVEAIESQRTARLAKGIRPHVLQHEHHAVCTRSIQCAEIHGEVQVKRLREID